MSPSRSTRTGRPVSRTMFTGPPSMRIEEPASSAKTPGSLHRPRMTPAFPSGSKRMTFAEWASSSRPTSSVTRSNTCSARRSLATATATRRSAACSFSWRARSVTSTPLTRWTLRPGSMSGSGVHVQATSRRSPPRASQRDSVETAFPVAVTSRTTRSASAASSGAEMSSQKTRPSRPRRYSGR